MTTGNSKFGWILSAVLVVAGIGYLLSRGGYGEMSPTGYQYATALYSACNQKDRDKLDLLAEMIDQSKDQQKIGEAETEWLIAIIEQGKRRQWDEAAQEVRQLMLDQVHGT